MTQGALLSNFLRRRVIGQPDSAWIQIVWGLAFAMLAVLVRQALHPLVRQEVPFVTFFPAVLAASILAGPTGGATCIAACVVIAGGSQYLQDGRLSLERRGWVAALLFIASGAVVTLITATLRKALREVSSARDQERLILAELQHRVKNTLAIVQALAAQTVRSASDPINFEREFTSRLIALAEAHNLLSDTTWAPVRLDEVVRRALAAFTPGGERIVAQGEDVSLPPEHVVSLTLCLNELATNATKHGALSTPKGRVDIVWQVIGREPGRRLALTWTESGGPPVAAPARRGFGSRLLRQGLSNAARPKVRLEFPPSGVVWSAEFDLGAAHTS